jgi:Na+/H+-translocating membrane pyrophosphatase
MEQAPTKDTSVPSVNSVLRSLLLLSLLLLSTSNYLFCHRHSQLITSVTEQAPTKDTSVPSVNSVLRSLLLLSLLLLSTSNYLLFHCHCHCHRHRNSQLITSVMEQAPTKDTSVPSVNSVLRSLLLLSLLLLSTIYFSFAPEGPPTIRLRSLPYL